MNSNYCRLFTKYLQSFHLYEVFLRKILKLYNL